MGCCGGVALRTSVTKEESAELRGYYSDVIKALGLTRTELETLYLLFENLTSTCYSCAMCAVTGLFCVCVQ